MLLGEVYVTCGGLYENFSLHNRCPFVNVIFYSFPYVIIIAHPAENFYTFFKKIKNLTIFITTYKKT
jgi:hypothetical protein